MDGLVPVEYPRKFTGRKLAMLAFPLGGVGAGAIALGGRGQLRDWEIFNRSEKGKSPAYAFPAIWVQAGDAKPVAHVLEARILAPFEGHSGLGADNAPGLSRLEEATFTGEYPLATVAFHDARLPVNVTLEAFSPFVPLDPEGSGLPVAVMRYRVKNPGKAAAKVAIAFAIDNPVVAEGSGANASSEARVNEFKTSESLAGIFMHNPKLEENAARAGSFAVCVMDPAGGRVSHLSGWPKARWWTSPLLYWDDFSADGELGPEQGERNGVGSLCLQRTIAGGAETEFTFLLAWHFPNRTPARMGWNSDKGFGDTVIGNYYCRRFGDAWGAAQYAAQKLPELEERMRQFLTAMRETTLPAPVKEAALANASTLATTTTFRTADGRFFGWEGSGCCHGNCDHVWNYETTTHYLFPTLARSMRETHLELSAKLDGEMPIRVNLPLEHQTGGAAAADGQMGQIVKAYFDWQLSGDNDWLRKWWPDIKKALEFAWVPGGWDGDRDGVFEGVQHNTYDVEFYGPNPMCGIYYLAALRAGEEMARAMGEPARRTVIASCSNRAAQWIDGHLFNGEYYVQQVRGVARDQVAKGLIAGMGAEDPTHPDYQMGDGCLVDQLVGQHAAEYAGLGPAGQHGPHSQDAAIHLPLQLQAHHGAARQCAAHLRAERRSGAGDLRLRQGHAAAGAVSVFRRSDDRLRVLRGHADAGVWHGEGRAGVHREYPQALRRRAAQSVGRKRVRPALRARHGRLDGDSAAERLPVPRPGEAPGGCAAHGGRDALVLVHGHGMGHILAARGSAFHLDTVWNAAAANRGRKEGRFGHAGRAAGGASGDCHRGAIQRAGDDRRRSGAGDQIRWKAFRISRVE